MAQGLKGAFSGTSFASHVLAVSGSAFIAQALSVLVGPVNARLYHPADYGTLSLFGAMFMSMSVVSTMQYEMSLATADDDLEGMHLMLLCFLFIAGWTAIIVLATFTAAGPLTRMLSRNDLQFLRYIWFLPYGIAATALCQTFQRWAMRMRAFPMLSLTQVIQGFLASVCTVTLGFLHAGRYIVL